MGINLDFAAFWQEAQECSKNNRLEAAADLAFWAEYAPRYDGCTAPPGSYEQTLQVLYELVEPDDSLLDVGAGTGRFGLPLARRVSRVTALDYASPMLDIMRRKATRRQINNITYLEAAWEIAQVEAHDVVLAAWSLYRQPDLRAALSKLVTTTGRLLVIVDGEDDNLLLPHHRLKQAIWPKLTRPCPLPKHLCYLGVLWQLGLHAEVRVVYETRCLEQSTPQDLARLLAPGGASAAELSQFAAALHSLLTPTSQGWQYRFRHPVDILFWRAGSSEMRQTAGLGRSI